MSNVEVTTPVSSMRPYLKGRHLLFPLGLATSLFCLWGFSYGLLDVLNKNFQNILKITRFESTTLQIVYFGGGYFCFSPIAGEILRRKGYKVTIIFGLCLFAIGAISYWPAIHFSDPSEGRKAFFRFVVCTLIIACGLATLETSANSYVTVIGSPKTAALRLQFCQSWNGLASFTGPLLASKLFFATDNVTNLTNLKYVYIGVASVAVIVAILFIFCQLPEGIDEKQTNSSTLIDETSKPLWKQYNMIFAFFAIFGYVGTQVCVDSFFINYATENADFVDSTASSLLSYALMIFTGGRFVGTILANYFHADFILALYSMVGTILTIYVSLATGRTGVWVLMCLYFFESVMFPTIFVMGMMDLGRHARRGAGILIMGVSGGAVLPPIQGAIADHQSTRTSFFVPMIGLLLVFSYAVSHWIKHGTRIIKKSQKSNVEKTDQTDSPIQLKNIEKSDDSSPFLVTKPV